MSLSTHYTKEECACPCCGAVQVNSKLTVLMELVRGLNGNTPITPNSVYRCYFHNANIGGATNSQHLEGKAADMPVDDPQAVYEALCSLFPDSYGFGLYPTFIHIDCRDTKARWMG